eukprot:48699-Eustigmatos_ZCMA.PRE.1
MTVMENVRMACCGGGKQVISINQAGVDETLQLSEKFGGSPEDVAKVNSSALSCSQTVAFQSDSEQLQMSGSGRQPEMN